MLGTEREEAREERTMKIFGMGMPELILILVVVLIIFGPKNLPKLGGMLGQEDPRTRGRRRRRRCSGKTNRITTLGPRLAPVPSRSSSQTA